MDLRTRHLFLRADLTLRRAAVRRRRRLVRELSAYRTTGDRDDLLAAVDRCPAEAREEVRRVLAELGRPGLDRAPFHLHG